jgi:NagD protein
MDGVIYRENQLIPGAAELIGLFAEKGVPFLFLTNNSALTPNDLVVKLEHLGIPNLGTRHFYTSALNTADFLQETHADCTVYTIGDAGLVTALGNKHLANDSIGADYVVIGEGQFAAERILKAHELIEKGARLVVTNPDNWCPISATATRPGAGALATFLEASTGCRAYYLGKPNPYMFIKARQHLGAGIEQVVMIGDTMETDIRGSVEVGMQAYLVLTGSTELEDLANYVYQPTRVMNSVADLIEEIRTGKPGNRLNSPAFDQVKSLMGKLRLGAKHQTDVKEFGAKHQTDVIATRRARPRPAMTK